MDFDAIKKLDRKYHMPAYNRFNVAIVSGKGSIAVDVAGREYVDFSSGIGVNCLGYADAGWQMPYQSRLLLFSIYQTFTTAQFRFNLQKNFVKRADFPRCSSVIQVLKPTNVP